MAHHCGECELCQWTALAKKRMQYKSYSHDDDADTLTPPPVFHKDERERHGMVEAMLHMLIFPVRPLACSEKTHMQHMYA